MAAFADFVILIEKNTTETVTVEILHHTAYSACEEQYFTVGRMFKPFDLCNTVTYRYNGSDFVSECFRRP